MNLVRRNLVANLVGSAYTPLVTLVCVPIYKGKIDRSLLSAVMKAKGMKIPQPQVAAV